MRENIEEEKFLGWGLLLVDSHCIVDWRLCAVATTSDTSGSILVDNLILFES